MMNKYKSLTLTFAGLLGCATAHSAVVLVDFGNAKSDPTDANWNSGITVAGSGTYDLIDTTGSTTGIDIAFSGGLSDSTSSADHRGDRTAFPGWEDSSDLSLQDRVWSNSAATMTLSGLNTAETYDLELFSSYSSGSSGRGAAIMTMTDDNGAVEGFNVFPNPDTSLGTSVNWATNVQGTNGEEGWIGWFGMTPNASGEITLAIAMGSDDINPRGALNAMQLTSTPIPEPSSYGVFAGLLVLGLVARRRRG
jgi:hypothetical protein